ncbi:hypothetical protein K6N12_30690 [Rhizobium sp. 18T]|nr:hypothetical protein [Rhizobium redzepovicii]
MATLAMIVIFSALAAVMIAVLVAVVVFPMAVLAMIVIFSALAAMVIVVLAVAMVVVIVIVAVAVAVAVAGVRSAAVGNLIAIATGSGGRTGAGRLLAAADALAATIVIVRAEFAIRLNCSGRHAQPVFERAANCAAAINDRRGCRCQAAACQEGSNGKSDFRCSADHFMRLPRLTEC